WLWPIAEKIIRRHTGVGSLPVEREPHLKEHVFLHADVVVIGGGPAGRAAAKAAGADPSTRVLVVDEGLVGAGVAPGPVRDRIRSLRLDLRAMSNVDLREDHVAVGVYDGPLVPVVGPEELLEVD